MTSLHIDPDLIGIWLLPGEPQTYEVEGDGSYHIADPDEPVRFEENGAAMIWGGRRFSRAQGDGDTPVGTWCEDATGDGWDFTEDHGLTILTANPVAPQTFIGIWALRNGGHSLWIREKHADLEADGAHLTFHLATGDVLRYGYAVDDGVLALLDPDNWTEIARYIAADLFHATVAAS